MKRTLSVYEKHLKRHWRDHSPAMDAALVTVEVSITVDQKARLNAMAKEQGRSINDILRELVLKI